MSKKNKLTPNQDKYKELRRRLKRKLRDVKKRGMTPNRAFNEEWLGDEIPEKVRKPMLEKMEKALKTFMIIKMSGKRLVLKRKTKYRWFLKY